MNHNRTLIYFIGFLMGCILIGWIVHMRNIRREKETWTPKWIGITLSDTDIRQMPQEWTQLAEPLESAVLEQKDGSHLKGVFLRHRELGLPLWAIAIIGSDGTPSGWILHYGDRLLVHSHPGISPDLMQDGFNHVGTPLLDPQPATVQPPVYAVGFETQNLSDLLIAAEMLQSKQLYIAAVEWVPVESDSSTGHPIFATQSE